MDVLRARGGYDLLPGPGDPNQAGTGGSGLALPLLANKFGRVSYARNNFRAPGVPMHNIGYLAAFLTTFAFLPQAIKTIRTRDTAGVSLLMYASMTMGIVFWLLHGIHLGDYALIGANSVLSRGFRSGTQTPPFGENIPRHDDEDRHRKK